MMNLIERASRRIKGLTPERRPEEHPHAAELHDALAFSAAPRQTKQQITVDLERLRSMGMAPPGDQSALSDEIRIIKRPLIDNAFSTAVSRPENANLIMVTSAGPNDGKTFVATNLAMSMASEHEVNVLLIDADIAHSAIPRTFGFEATRGLIDVLEEPTIDLADLLVRTDVENLTLLPSGRHIPLANELLASSKMTHFVNDIGKRYADRVVIFDSPPLLARSEASVLARHVGQIVLVVEAERTTRSAISDALRLIDQNKFVGIVLNKMPTQFWREGFGQYSYPYGNSASDPKKD